MKTRSGHVFVLRGDIRRLRCDAWALPADGAGRTDPSWVAWPPGAAAHLGAPEPFPHWTREARRARPLAGWPSNLPAPWLLHVELDAAVPSSWLVEAAVGFVEDAAARAREGRRPPGRTGRPLLALPLGVAGIGAAEGGAARKAAGGLARELLPELREIARARDVDIALVAHADDSLAATRAARLQVERVATDLPAAVVRGLAPAAAAIQHGRLVLCVGPALARREGLPAWPELLTGIGRRAGLPEAWQRALVGLPLHEQAAAVADAVGGRGALARAVSEQLARHSVGLVHCLLAGLDAPLVLGTGPDDQLEQAWAAAGRPLEVLLDGPPRPGAARLLLRQGSIRSPRDMADILLEPGRRQERVRSMALATRAGLPADAHVLVVGFPPGAELVATLRTLAACFHADGSPADKGPHFTVLSEGPDTVARGLWPDGLIQWLSLDDGADAAGPAGATARDTDDLARQSRVGHRLACTLDALGSQAGVRRRCLDPDQRSLLAEPDQALARGVDEMLDRLPAKARQALLWPDLVAWLKAQGHPGR